MNTGERKINRAKHGGDDKMAEVEEKRVHFFSYMDKQGRILVPLRNREEVDIAGIVGADVEVNMIVKKVYMGKK